MSATDSTPATRPRWRFTFRLSTLFVVITAIAIVCAWPRIDREIHLYQLRPFLNRDLRELDEDERAEFERVMNYIYSPAVTNSSRPFMSDWYLWDVQTTRGRRLVLFQGQQRLTSHGSAHAQFFMFTERGDYICREAFFIGNQIDLLDAVLLTDELPGETLVVAKTQTDSWRHADVAQRYYALMDDRMVFIRQENSQNKIVTQSLAELRFSANEEQLTSADWLHRLSDKRETRLLYVLHEIYSRRDMFFDFQLDPEVRNRVAQLTRHPHPWVAEMAAVTLKKLRERDSQKPLPAEEKE